MSLSLEGNPPTSENLVETLTVEGDSNLSLTTNDLEQLAHLSHELQLSSEMDTTASEGELMDEEQDDEQPEAAEPEIGAQEIEIETERHSPEEITPNVKTTKSIPPLRPLTIAPKPTKVPIALKSAGGQQLLLLQGNSPGQPLKLVSSQGQGISLANISLGKPITIRPTKAITANAASVLQPKQVVMKKVIQQQKVTGDGKNVVELKHSQPSIVLPSPTKTITLAQAQQIGLLTGAKIVPQMAGKQAIVVSKSQNKAIKLVPQVKPHAKILPAPQVVTGNKVGQRIILKQANANPIVGSGQIIQVASGGPLIAGQLHQINIPGKGVQYIKIVTPTTNTDAASSNTNTTIARSLQVTTSEAKVLTTTANANKSATVVLATESPGGAALTPKLKTTAVTRSAPVHLPTTSHFMMVPANVMAQAGTVVANKVPIPAIKTHPVKLPVSAGAASSNEINLESNGMRPRKPCNCTKSQCLKLYCDCFANGEFCYLCNCMNCYNNLENEEHRQRAIKSCLERNPNAFRPKIGKARDTSGDTAIRKHTKGCNCKRSGCLKNYCECYEAKIACSSNCKCLGCRNIEDLMEKKCIIPPINTRPIPTSPPISAKLGLPRGLVQFRPRRHSGNKHAFNFITDDVIEATTQCLLTISDSGESTDQDEELTKKQIIEEFGRCLKEIIDCSMKSAAANSVN